MAWFYYLLVGNTKMLLGSSFRNHLLNFAWTNNWITQTKYGTKSSLTKWEVDLYSHPEKFSSWWEHQQPLLWPTVPQQAGKNISDPCPHLEDIGACRNLDDPSSCLQDLGRPTRLWALSHWKDLSELEGALIIHPPKQRTSTGWQEHGVSTPSTCRTLAGEQECRQVLLQHASTGQDCESTLWVLSLLGGSQVGLWDLPWQSRTPLGHTT